MSHTSLCSVELERAYSSSGHSCSSLSFPCVRMRMGGGTWVVPIGFARFGALTCASSLGLQVMGVSMPACVALSRCAKSRQSRSRGDRTARRHYTEYTATCTHVLHSTLKVLLGSLATSLHSPVMSQGGAVALSPFYIVPDGRSWPFDVSFDGDFTGMQVVR